MSRRAPTRVLAAERTALVVIVGVFLLPVAWLITTAYKPGRDIFSFPPTFAFTPTLDNFRGVFRYFDLYHLVQSSLIITLGSVALSLLIGVPAGYALARSRSRYAVGVAYFFLAIRTVPPIATLIPFYLMMRDIGLLGTWWAVVLINATLNSAFVVWMMFSYFRSLPKELEEAALTDGCTLIGAFFRVALPLVDSRHRRERAPLRHVQLERLHLLGLPDAGRHEADLGGAARRLRHQGHQLGHARRAGAFLDHSDRADRADAEPLFRAGADARRRLTAAS